MGQDQGQVGAPVEAEEKRPEEIRREIESTREALGDTVAALAEKTDVKARAKEKVEGVKEQIGSFEVAPAVAQVKTKARQNPIVVAAVAALVGGLLIRRLRSRS